VRYSRANSFVGLPQCGVKINLQADRNYLRPLAREIAERPFSFLTSGMED